MFHFFCFHTYLYIKRYRCCYICACVCIRTHASIIFIVLVLCQCSLCHAEKLMILFFVFSSPRKIPLFNFDEKNTEKCKRYAQITHVVLTTSCFFLQKKYKIKQNFSSLSTLDPVLPFVPDAATILSLVYFSLVHLKK